MTLRATKVVLYRLCVLLVLLVSEYKCDIYLHNPRGSNNRLDEAGRERNNGNRMFDSQNNDRGGYNVGGLYYYEGTTLPIEWTNQHSCGGPNNHCELIVQYMCDKNVRDGSSTATIPENPAQCEDYNCNTDLEYGMNEDYDYYVNCKKRQRNDGLFLADQKLKGNTAKYTRQNPGGTRRGYECPEERDYYPYWHPTPWRDVAVLVNDVSRCKFYQEESENVKGRFHCVVPYMLKMQNANQRNFVIPNNKEDCEAFRWPANDENGARAEWKQADSHGIPPPICQENQFSRDNHLGNGPGGYPNLYNWTIPAHAIDEQCVMRLRYNISTEDYDGWDGSVNASLNNNRKNEGSKVDLSAKYGFADAEEAKNRGYVLENNPQVKIFNTDKFALQLAINTAEFGRTFQDRSHIMAVRRRPASMEGQRIFNLNVRGKRGNIVQVYPAVEYDYVPNNLVLSKGDYVHMQWTGSNTNPQNNDGQGRAGTDRSNIVLQTERAYSENSGTYWQSTNKFGHWGRSYPLHLDEGELLGLSREDRQHLALLSPGQFGGKMSELDDAGTYFDLGPRKVTQSGVTHIMCTRNNNFSNRSQKGKIVVKAVPSTENSLGYSGGELALPDKTGLVKVSEGVLPKLTHMQIETWPSDVGDERIKSKGQELDLGNDYAGDFLVINPQESLTAEDRTFTVEMKVDTEAGNNVKIYRSNEAHFSSWLEMDAVIENGVARFEASNGGVYVARSHSNAGVIAGIVIACLVVVIVIAGTAIYFRRKPEKGEAIRRRFQNVKRSTQSAI